jgi:hypothetical protein
MRRILRIASCVAVCLLSLGPAAASASAEGFGYLPGAAGFSVSAENADGTPATQAGSHPFAFTTDLNLIAEPGVDLRDAHVALPPGLVGNPTVIDRCNEAQFQTKPESGSSKEGETIVSTTECPNSAAIGTARIILGGTAYEIPVFNLVAPPGVPAEFGFVYAGVEVALVPHIRTDGSYGLTVDSINTSQAQPLTAARVTIWGVPYEAAHDTERGTCLAPSGVSQGSCPITSAPRAYLTLPSSCSGPQTTTVTADSWQRSGAYLPDGEPDLLDPAWVSATSAPLGLEGCARVPYAPTVAAQPTTDQTTAATGLDFDLNVVDEGLTNPTGVAQSETKKAIVALPEGFTVNPSAGAGLSACSLPEYEAESLHSAPSEGCPESSKIGTIEAESPLVEEPVKGSLYIAKQTENPFGSLLGFYFVARNSQLGVFAKAAGKVEADPRTGQLTTTFDNLPQLPISHFRLAFRQGQTSPLVSPPACGTYTATAALYPWSDPEVPLQRTATFQVDHGPSGGPCPAGGVPPFKPQVISGTQNNAGGSYSPFYLRILREDGEQELTRFSTTLPPGLTGNLTGIPFCPDAAVQRAKEKSGAQEEAEPSCPAASEVGHTIVSAGVGSVLAQTPGKIYLAGPYNGAPLSIVSVTAAKVGPFDLGTVVIRFALDINPTTAQVEVSASGSDPIPHIIKGIVVHVREIHVYMNRSNFILNPTNCERLQISNTIDGAGADFTNPADQVPVTVTTPFEAADCSTLQFKPTFKVTTSGKTSRSGGASLAVKLTYPNAPQGSEANIARVKVDLPKQLPSRLTTLQKACTSAQFNANPAGCPAASFIGHAKAVTPLIPVPLEGPAIFVSHGGEAFPSLIMVLQGYGVTIDLVGSTNISKSGITSSTFKAVPDQPVGSFELTLPQGKYSALAANGNLCKSKLAMPTEFLAQNGMKINQTTHIEVEGCPNTISISSHKVKGKTATIGVSVPSAGKLTVSGKGVSKASKTASGREIISLVLNQKKPGKLKTTVRIGFTPSTGKSQSKTIDITFKK